MCILAESNQLIKFRPLVTNRLRPKSKTECPHSLCHAAYIGWWEWPVKKVFICRACSTHERLIEFSRCSLSANSINVHHEMGSQLDECTVLKPAYRDKVPAIHIMFSTSDFEEQNRHTFAYMYSRSLIIFHISAAKLVPHAT